MDKRASISSIAEALRETNHNGFPVVDRNSNGDNRLLGIITRNTLMIILKNLHLVPDCADSLLRSSNYSNRTAEEDSGSLSVQDKSNRQLDSSPGGLDDDDETLDSSRQSTTETRVDQELDVDVIHHSHRQTVGRG